jgi:chemotaxis protein methyltransferase CheR
MNDFDYKFFEQMLHRESGLAITQDKMYLLESRLMPVATRHKLQGLEGIAKKLREGADPELQRAVIEAMTTNETSFFRDNSPFNLLKDSVFPVMLKSRATVKYLRIWSAACSSGQEPYSIAMLLTEMAAAFAGWKFEILATDISQDILTQAKQGVYTQFEVQRGLPIHLLVKYFTQTGDKWQVKPDIKNMVTFRQANLLKDVPMMGAFDIVLCRNVLIYFDVPTKTRVLQGMRNAVKQDGVLVLGGTETVLGLSDEFRTNPDVKGLYVRNDSTFQPIKKDPPPGGAAGTSAIKK